MLEPLLGLVGAIERIEIGGDLDVRVAPQRRRRRNAVVYLDRQLGLLERLVEVGERQQRHRVRRLEIERKLQIDQRQIFAAAASDRGAEAVQRFGGAGLRGIDQRRQFLAGRDFLHFLHDHRMIGHRFIELLIDLERVILAAVARQEAAIGFDGAQRRRSRPCRRAHSAGRHPSCCWRRRE